MAESCLGMITVNLALLTSFTSSMESSSDTEPWRADEVKVGEVEGAAKATFFFSLRADKDRSSPPDAPKVFDLEGARRRRGDAPGCVGAASGSSVRVARFEMSSS